MTVSGEDHGLRISADRGGVAGESFYAPVTVNNLLAPREVVWPVWVGSAPSPAQALQPREAARQAVDAAWDTSRSGVVALTQTVLGDGGVGKSQLAAAIARDAAASGTDLVVWVNASSRDQITAAYAVAAGRVQAPGHDPTDADVAADAFLSWLATTTRTWLIVLDDLSLLDQQMTGLWPGTVTSAGRGKILVTTRDRSAGMRGTRVDLGVFTPDESLTYLQQRVTEYQGPAALDVLGEADALAADLQHLPVALAQAIAVVLDQGITTAAYRTRFHDRAATLEKLFPAGAPADEYAHTVATTWSLALEQAATISRFARPVAELVCLLDPAGAPDTVLTSDPARVYLTFRVAQLTGGDASSPDPPAVSDSEASVEDAIAGIRALHRLSVISHDPAAGPTAVRVHALAQRAIANTMQTQEMTQVLQAVADSLLQVWPEHEHDAALGTALRANTAHLSNSHQEALWDTDADGCPPLLFRSLSSLGDTGQLTAAGTAAQDLLSQISQALGPDHPHTLVARGNLASLLGKAGNPVAAAAAFEDLLTELLQALGPDHPNTFAARANLASWRGNAGDPAWAAAAFEDLLADRERVLGPDHPDTLTTRNNLAGWRGEAGDLAEAAAAFEDLLADRERVLGPDHPDTLTTRNNFASLLGKTGHPAAAAAAFEDLLTELLRVLGPDHPNTLAARGSVAGWRGEAGDYAGAVTAFEDLLTDSLRVLGSDHPDTLTARLYLANCVGNAGDPAGAAAAFEGLLPDCLRVLGPDHPDTLTTRNNLANWRGEAGDYGGAAAAFEGLLPDCLRVLGPDHPDTLTTRNNLAGWRGEAGDPAGAAAALEDLLTDCLRVLGPDHPDTLTTRNNLTDWRGESGG